MSDKSERRPPRQAEPTPDRRTRDDPHATPLGRGAEPGPAAGPRPTSGGPAIAGRRGMSDAGAAGGPSGLAHRENKDALARSRRDEVAQDGESADAER